MTARALESLVFFTVVRMVSNCQTTAELETFRFFSEYCHVYEIDLT